MWSVIPEKNGLAKEHYLFEQCMLDSGNVDEENYSRSLRTWPMRPYQLLEHNVPRLRIKSHKCAL
jgi:hypothetical protein